MLYTIKRYRPAFCTGFPVEWGEFSCHEELLAIGFVDETRKTPGFLRLSTSEDLLIAHFMERGKETKLVIGTIKTLTKPFWEVFRQGQVSSLPLDWHLNPLDDGRTEA